MTARAAAALDAVVVGSGPNGLAAAVTLARAGASVLVLEAAGTPGGGTRSAELTLPGFVHDVCSAIVPLAAASPFFKDVPLDEYGLEFCFPEIELAHPFDDGSAGKLLRSVEDTAYACGSDARAYRKLMSPLVSSAEGLVHELIGPLRMPRHALAMGRFGLLSLRSALGLVNHRFRGPHAKGLLAGIAAHSVLPLNRRPSGSVALVLGMLGHSVGWPAARGGTQRISDALVAYLEDLGGTVETGVEVKSLGDLPPHKVVLFDLAPRSILRITGDHFPVRYRKSLARFRYGPGVFKVDWALSGPVPWQSEDTRRAGTVHLGGTVEEIAASEEAVARGRHPERPFVILSQPSIFDDSRAPKGKHTLWGYCHVPAGSDVDMSEAIERQIERFAPGFKDLVLGNHVMSPVDLESYNANYVGGDINGGMQDLRQLFTRPVARLRPYTTPDPKMFICSSSSPPGGGVHGMAGYFAAKTALRRPL